MSDYSNVYALLIGTSSFSDTAFPDIPNIRKNLEALELLLTDELYLGIPKSNITTLIDAESIKILTTLSDITRTANTKKSNLILYYSGHGAISDTNSRLFLTAKNTQKRYLEDTAVDVEDFKEKLRTCRAGQKIIILDACFSGRFGTLSNQEYEIQAQIEQMEGDYVMTATDEYTAGTFNPNENNIPTDFTGKMLDIIKKGIENEQPYIKFSEIFEEIKTDFSRRKGKAIPRQWTKGEGHRIELIKNSFYQKSSILSIWNNVKEKNTIPDFEDFISRFPKSEYIEEAKSIVSKLKDELAILEKIKHSAVIDEFVQEYQGNWNHLQWLDFKNKIYKTFGSIDERKLGEYIEERNIFWRATRNKPENNQPIKTPIAPEIISSKTKEENSSSFTDARDGKSYKIIRIGKQVWLAENLNFEIEDSYDYNLDKNLGQVYGKLYSWNAALKACPAGWKIPSDGDWKQLELELGIMQNELSKNGWRGNISIKIKSLENWYKNQNGNNLSGFNALPAGYRGSDHKFSSLLKSTTFWTSSQFEDARAWNRRLAYGYLGVFRGYNYLTDYYSVRCILQE